MGLIRLCRSHFRAEVAVLNCVEPLLRIIQVCGRGCERHQKHLYDPLNTHCALNVHVSNPNQDYGQASQRMAAELLHLLSFDSTVCEQIEVNFGPSCLHVST